MKNFAFVSAKTMEEATNSLGSEWQEAAVMAGGTDLVGEMKDYIYNPDKVVNLKSVPGLDTITDAGTAIDIGAMATVESVASDTNIKSNFNALSLAAGQVASPQLRKMGTIGGNICQRPRCWYYRDPGVPCMKKGGRRCYSIAGVNTYHAILGGGPCHIVHPSDTAVALMAFETTLTLADKYNTREVPFAEFFVLPDEDVNRENILKPDEIVTKINVAKPEAGTKSTFIKVQEREAWDFAIAEAAVSMKMEGSRCTQAKVVLGAAAPIPWRSQDAENELVGKTITPAVAERAGTASVSGNRPMTGNAYKVKLFENIVKRAVLELM